MGDGGFPGLVVERRDGGLYAEVVVDPDGPWFDDHFPDAPVLPAIAHLELVCRAHRDGGGSGRIATLDRVRLSAPVRPGDRLALTLAPLAGGVWEFDLRAGDRAVSDGRVRWVEEPAS